jgi:hypothetical protein
LIPELLAFIARFLVVTDAQRLVLALWIVHTHLIEHVHQTPYLAITSPEPECAKSRVLEILRLFVARPWLISTPSTAVIYRQVHAKTPTLLWDEIDTVFNPQTAKYHQDLRALLDDGHRRDGAMVPRAANFGKDVEHFNVFCAKALAGIGTLPDTIASRAIYVRMQRKAKAEHVEKFKHRDVEPEAEPLRERIAEWAEEYGRAVEDARPVMPDGLSDRMEEGCEPLVAIADLLGCGEEARAALVELLAGDRLDTHESMRMRLLRDLDQIWSAAEQRIGKRILGIHTHVLISQLWKLDTAPWLTYYGRGLSAKDIADLLKQYGIESKQVKYLGKSAKGYRRDDLWPVFERYVR